MALVASDLRDLEQNAVLAPSAGEPSIAQVDITAAGEFDGIEDLLVFITLDVSDDVGWDTTTGNQIRKRVFDHVVTQLGALHPDASYSVTTYLRPRDDLAA